MRKHSIFLSLFLIFISCERGWIRNLISSENEKADTTGPTVVISSHTSGQTVFDIITLMVNTEDDGGINKVEFFIDDSLVFTDTESPYQYDWNTTRHESNSEHIIKVISYDNSGNSTLSQSILLKVDHTSSLPNGGNVTSVTYTLTEMTVEWEQSTNEDFNDYKLLHSNTESGVRDTLETYTDKSITSYNTTEFNPLIENWFWVQVTDTLGLSSVGSGMCNALDNPPNPVNVTSVTYNLESMTINWEDYVPNPSRINQMNQNTRSTVINDFVSYELLHSDTENGTYTSVIIITEQSTTSHSFTDYNPTQENWFKVKVTDYWGLNSIGSGMCNEIPPFLLPSQIISIDVGYVDIQNGFFDVKWSKNQNDSLFNNYVLQISDFYDFSSFNAIVIDNINDTSFVYDEIYGVDRYFRVLSRDFWDRSISGDSIQKTLRLTFEKYYDNKNGKNSSIIEVSNVGYVFSYSENYWVNPSLAYINPIGTITNSQSLFNNGIIWDLSNDVNSGKFIVSAHIEYYNDNYEALSYMSLNDDFTTNWSVEEELSNPGFGIVNISDYNDGSVINYKYVVDNGGGVVFKSLDGNGNLICIDDNNNNLHLVEGRALTKVGEHVFSVVQGSSIMIAVDPVDDGCTDDTALISVGGDTYEYASIDKTVFGELLVLYKINGNIFRFKKINPNSLDWGQSTEAFNITLPVQLADNGGQHPLVRALSNGNIIVLGSILESIGQSLNSVILLYSADGNLIISKEFENIQLTDAKETNLTGGGIIFTGDNYLGGQSVIIKTDFNLNY